MIQNQCILPHINVIYYDPQAINFNSIFSQPGSPKMQSGKTKHIRKSLEEKITLFLQEERPKKEDANIFIQSEDDSNRENHYLKNEKHSALMPTLKIESPEEDSSSEQEKKEVTMRPSMLPRSQNKFLENQSLGAYEFKRVQEVDFEIYTGFMAKTRVYGAVLVDFSGKILWCDKIGHELLEGSLNNLAKNPITSLLLDSEWPNFLRQLQGIRKFDDRTILHWVIYSKVTRRRYKSIPLASKPSSEQIFYRFLRGLTVRIRPVAICLPNYRDKNGFCNEELIPKNYPGECFFLEIRLSKRPKVKALNIENDIILRNFVNAGIQETRKTALVEKMKEERKGIEASQSEEDEDEKEDEKQIFAKYKQKGAESIRAKTQYKRRRQTKREAKGVK